MPKAASTMKARMLTQRGMLTSPALTSTRKRTRSSCATAINQRKIATTRDAGLLFIPTPPPASSHQRHANPALRRGEGDLLHRGVGALEPIDRKREVQWLLDLPDSLMLARQHLSRIVDGDPGDGHRCSRSEVGLEVDDAVDAHFAALAEVSGMKDCCTRGNEHFIVHGAARDVSIRADQAVIADAQRMG